MQNENLAQGAYPTTFFLTGIDRLLRLLSALAGEPSRFQGHAENMLSVNSVYTKLATPPNGIVHMTAKCNASHCFTEETSTACCTSDAKVASCSLQLESVAGGQHNVQCNCTNTGLLARCAEGLSINIGGGPQVTLLHNVKQLKLTT